MQHDVKISTNTMLKGIKTAWRASTRLKTLSEDMFITEFRRCLTTFDLIVFSTANMGISGLFVITGIIIRQKVGPGAWLAFLLAGVTALLNALNYAELASRIPRAGSAFVYTYVSMGELPGFIVGWCLILEYMFSISTCARSFSNTMNALTNNSFLKFNVMIFGKIPKNPVIDIDIVPFLIVLVCMIPLILGAKSSVVWSNIFTGVNLVTVTIIIVILFCYAHMHNWTHAEGGYFPFGAIGVINAAGICFYSYTGFDCICVCAEETKNPSRSAPIALSVSVVVSCLLFCLVSASLTLYMPWNLVDIQASVVAAFSYRDLRWAKYVAGVGALIGITGSLTASEYSLPRLVYAMASEGLLPRFLSTVSKSTQVPYMSILIFCPLGGILGSLLSVEVQSELVSIGTLFAYIIVSATLIKLRYRDLLCNEDSPMVNDSRDKLDDILDEDTMLIDKYYTPGALKEKFRSVPVINKAKPGIVINGSIGVLILALIGLSSVLLYAGFFQGVGHWWAIILLVICVAVVIATLALIVMHRQTYMVTFKVPFVPVLPTICMLMNALLIVHLSWLSWVRMAGWMMIGTVIYFAYGMHNTNEAELQRKLETSKEVQSDSLFKQ